MPPFLMGFPIILVHFKYILRMYQQTMTFYGKNLVVYCLVSAWYIQPGEKTQIFERTQVIDEFKNDMDN